MHTFGRAHVSCWLEYRGDVAIRSPGIRGTLLGNPTHQSKLVCAVLQFSSEKNKRIRHSKSHAEALSTDKSTQQAQLFAKRRNKIVHVAIVNVMPTSSGQLNRQITEMCAIPTHHLSDCSDLVHFVTGSRGVPGDRTPELAILILLEDRLVRRIKRSRHSGTEFMFANPSLTQVCTSRMCSLVTLTGFSQRRLYRAVVTATLRVTSSTVLFEVCGGSFCFAINFCVVLPLATRKRRLEPHETFWELLVRDEISRRHVSGSGRAPYTV